MIDETERTTCFHKLASVARGLFEIGDCRELGHAAGQSGWASEAAERKIRLSQAGAANIFHLPFPPRLGGMESERQRAESTDKNVTRFLAGLEVRSLRSLPRRHATSKQLLPRHAPVSGRTPARRQLCDNILEVGARHLACRVEVDKEGQAHNLCREMTCTSL